MTDNPYEKDAPVFKDYEIRCAEEDVFVTDYLSDPDALEQLFNEGEDDTLWDKLSVYLQLHFAGKDTTEAWDQLCKSLRKEAGEIVSQKAYQILCEEKREHDDAMRESAQENNRSPLDLTLHNKLVIKSLSNRGVVI